MVRGKTVMKRRKKYTMSDRRKHIDALQTNFDRRIEIFTLMNQGWKSKQVAERLGTSRQNVENTYNKIKHQTIDELTKQRNKYQSSLVVAIQKEWEYN